MPQNNATKNEPAETKPTPGLGRPEDQINPNSGGNGSAPAEGSSKKAGVVIRAWVEHLGVVGETELTVNVKWPAAAFCVAPSTPPADSGTSQDSLNVPANAPSAKIRTVTGKK